MSKRITVFTLFSLGLSLGLAMAPGLSLAALDGVDSADLTLKVPAEKASYIIDGAEWQCSGTECHAGFVDDMPAFRSCKRVVAVTGAVTRFSYRGKVLSDAEIAVCNTRAK